MLRTSAPLTSALDLQREPRVMDIANLQDNRLAISVISLVGGIVLNQLITALRSKTSVLGYITYFNRIGLECWPG